MAATLQVKKPIPKLPELKDAAAAERLRIALNKAEALLKRDVLDFFRALTSEDVYKKLGHYPISNRPTTENCDSPIQPDQSLSELAMCRCFLSVASIFQVRARRLVGRSNKFTSALGRSGLDPVLREPILCARGHHWGRGSRQTKKNVMNQAFANHGTLL
jgi:hypothetical protein